MRDVPDVAHQEAEDQNEDEREGEREEEGHPVAQEDLCLGGEQSSECGHRSTSHFNLRAATSTERAIHPNGTPISSTGENELLSTPTLARRPFTK